MKIITIVFLALSYSAQASEHIVADNIWTAVEKTEALARKYGPTHVLFASDLDNTLLKTKRDLASELGFNWQDELLKEPANEHRIACDVPDLLHFFYVTIALSQLSPVQEDQSKAIQKMQAQSIPTIIVTARGEAVASSTFRELNKNNLDFSKVNLAGNGYGAPHLPWDLAKPEASGLTQKDIEKLKL